MSGACWTGKWWVAGGSRSHFFMLKPFSKKHIALGPAAFLSKSFHLLLKATKSKAFDSSTRWYDFSKPNFFRTKPPALRNLDWLIYQSRMLILDSGYAFIRPQSFQLVFSKETFKGTDSVYLSFIHPTFIFPTNSWSMADFKYCNTLWQLVRGSRAPHSWIPLLQQCRPFSPLLAKAVLKISSCRYRNTDIAARRDAIVMHRLNNFYKPWRYFCHFICSLKVIWMIYYFMSPSNTLLLPSAWLSLCLISSESW